MGETTPRPVNTKPNCTSHTQETSRPEHSNYNDAGIAYIYVITFDHATEMQRYQIANRHCFREIRARGVKLPRSLINNNKNTDLTQIAFSPPPNSGFLTTLNPYQVLYTRQIPSFYTTVVLNTLHLTPVVLNTLHLASTLVR